METVIKSNNNRLLILGGGGFIGTYLAKEALIRGFDVSILSKNFKKNSQKLDGIEYFNIDVRKQDELTKFFKNKMFHHVINLCGYVDHSNYFDEGHKVIDVHLIGTKNVINCINRESLISFIQIGSSDEYGSHPAPQSEELRELPMSSYSFAKTASTHFLKMLNLTENFPAVILRPFLVYGPGQKNSRFIPQIIQGCLNDSDFPVSHGEQLRDFCFISDISEAIFLALNNSNIHGEIINIGSGKPVSIKEVVELIQNIIGSGSPKFGEVRYRVGENMALFADISKARKLLNWNPKIVLKEGLKKTIEFYQNPHLINSI